MTLVLNLPAELQERLTEEASRRGMAVDALAVEVLAKQLPSNNRRKELVNLLQSWIDDEEVDEQKETGEYLIRVLDEDRLSDRKLFPPELKGKTW